MSVFPISYVFIPICNFRNSIKWWKAVVILNMWEYNRTLSIPQGRRPQERNKYASGWTNTSTVGICFNIIWAILPSHNIILLSSDVLGCLFLLLFLTHRTKLSQILHEHYLGLEAFRTIKCSKSELYRLYAKPLWERFNFCFRNESKNNTPQKFAQIEHFRGVLFLLPFLRLKLNL